jgi:translation initiation factor IF-2
MAVKSKKYRINKVAAELNVSWKNLVEHLQNKGFEVDNKITAKIDQSMYEVLQADFHQDKQAKEESQNLEINIRKDAETETIQKSTPKKKKSGFGEDEVLIKDLNVSNKPEDSQKEDKPEAPKEEVVSPASDLEGPKVVGKIDLDKDKKEESKKEQPKEEETPKEEPVQEKKEEKEEAKEKESVEKPKLKGPKVLGKIELDKDDDSKKEKEEKKEESKPESKEEKPKEKEAEAEKGESEDGEKSDEEKEADELKKTEYTKLSGLKVKGKIELPKTPEKKKAGEDAKKKRKRKIKAVKVTAADLEKEKRGRKRRGSKDDKVEISEKEIQEQIKATMAKITQQKGNKATGSRSKARKQRREEHRREREEQQAQQEKASKILEVTEYVTASELANLMDVHVNEIISACFTLGMMVSINQRLDAETIQVVSEEFGYEVKFVDAQEAVEVDEEDEDDPEDLEPRAPVVTVMGHVDHGKTSLLDYVRSANVIAGEAGGITQHVAAYEVTLKNKKKITFVDTPGHEAFTAMRARGAKVTDIVVIVIAADDAVMPQTKEAISHSQAAGVPIVFAFNKMDKEGANADRIREQLSNMDILVEEWGGKYQTQEISAKSGMNIDDLLEKILLEAEILELKANPDKNAKGTVMEAKVEKGRGVVTSILVQEGTLRVGDTMIAGQHYAKVKAMFNERGKNIEEAGPATPTSILGFSGTPAAGDVFKVMDSEQEAKDIATKRAQYQREQGIRATKHLTLDEIGRRLAIGNFKELNIIVKADVDGSAEALSDSLIKLSTEEIQVNVIQKGVGQISESDVLLATASDAIIIGFQVRPSPGAKKIAETEQIDIRHYSVIYHAIEEIKSAMEGMLSPDFEEKILGTAEIREVFKISKVGSVAGCMVVDGKIVRDAKVRLIREGVVVYTGELESLKRFKDDVKEVSKNYECGMQIKNYNDIKEGDLIEAFQEVEVKRKL